MSAWTGEILRRLRLKNGYTQAEVEEKVGASRGMVSHWERGSRQPLESNRKKLEDLLGPLDAPLEDVISEQEVNPEGLPEGAICRVAVNRYERKGDNRKECIRIHGDTCKACGFDFSAVYGEIGRLFIHVHHVTPVSQIGAGYVVNPETDLVPVCANCHAMLHRKNPPLTVDQLKKRIQIPWKKFLSGF